MKKEDILGNYDKEVDIGRWIFMEYDQELLIRKFFLEADGQWFYLTYLNTPSRISRNDGRIEEQLSGAWTECRDYSTVMTIYDLLCHHKGDALWTAFFVLHSKTSSQLFPTRTEFDNKKRSFPCKRNGEKLRFPQGEKQTGTRHNRPGP